MSDKENNCLHCGKGKSMYCENCYQELIAENARLQVLAEKLRNENNILTEKLIDLQEMRKK